MLFLIYFIFSGYDLDCNIVEGIGGSSESFDYVFEIKLLRKTVLLII